VSLQWKADETCRLYTALEMTRVWEIQMDGDQWQLRVRPRAWTRDPLEWRVLGEYKNPATAMAYADYERETMTTP
jgi:hypothetical protein